MQEYKTCDKLNVLCTFISVIVQTRQNEKSAVTSELLKKKPFILEILFYFKLNVILQGRDPMPNAMKTKGPTPIMKKLPTTAIRDIGQRNRDRSNAGFTKIINGLRSKGGLAVKVTIIYQ